MSPLTEPTRLTLTNNFTWNETVWNPSMISTSLWLDAADASTVTTVSGAVTTWRDKSGNNRHAISAGNPTFSVNGIGTGKPAIQLDGTGDRFVSSVSGINTFNALDVYMVVQPQAAAAANTNSAIFWGFGNLSAASNPYPAQSGLSFNSSSGLLSGETILLICDKSEFQGRLGSSTYSRSGNTLQLLQSSVSNMGAELRLNGASIQLDLANGLTTSSNTAPSNTGYAVDSDLHIGTLRSNGVLLESPAIKFGEFIVLSTTANADTRQRIEGYLAHKWGLTANLPSNHPYKTVGPTP